jgi:hypothetical protein
MQLLDMRNSSVLPVDNRDYFYPSVGVSFCSNKSFLQVLLNNKILNYLKVAASVSKQEIQVL